MTETGVIRSYINEKGEVTQVVCDVRQSLPDGFAKDAGWVPVLTASDKAWLTDAWKRWRKDGPK